MRLKIVTTGLLIAGFLFLLLGPLLLTYRPASGASQEEFASFGLMLLTYFTVTALTFLATAVCALMLVRRTKEEYREQASKNLRGLIEGTLKDHGRPRD